MIERMKDKFFRVRIQAIITLSKFQDPKNISDPIINEFLQILSNDINK